MTDTDPKTEAIYRSMLMARSEAERFLMGVRMCEAARMTVVASLPGGIESIEKKVAMLRRYYASDFSEEALVKIEASIRRTELTNPAAAARDFPGNL